ncbi:unnamed protein product [Effrenium voratum]|uniref:Secreted protein n=1 Tax=Effrenium voratum TaxID=2562239 RepID=A0AA36JT44_9DINO|nr:unnamed protein product [Effrenium voratum]
MFAPMILGVSLFIGLVLADTGGNCPTKGHQGVRLLQQNQRLGRHSLDVAQAALHSSSLLSVLSEPVTLPAVHAEVAKDGASAVVHFEHGGQHHRYSLDSFSIYRVIALWQWRTQRLAKSC